jgi:hypothetical protein
MIQITQNSISSHTTGVNIMKSPWRNPVHQGLSNNTKDALQCPLKKISFDFVEFFWRNYPIVNNSRNTCLNNMKPFQYTPPHQEGCVKWKAPQFGRSQWTNKLSSLTNVTISVPYQKHFESCMKLFISDRCVFCDFNTSQACRKTFQEWSWKIKYFIWFRHKNPMVNNNLNLPPRGSWIQWIQKQ